MTQNRNASSIMNALGPATDTFDFPEASLKFWSVPPILATQILGNATVAVVEQMDAHYREHFENHDALVTVHEWAGVTKHDAAGRKIMQNLTRDMQPKQREIIVNLGKGDSLAKKIVVSTIETITRFRRIPIEVFRQDDRFERRLKALLALHRPDWHP